MMTHQWRPWPHFSQWCEVVVSFIRFQGCMKEHFLGVFGAQGPPHASRSGNSHSCALDISSHSKGTVPAASLHASRGPHSCGSEMVWSISKARLACCVARFIVLGTIPSA